MVGEALEPVRQQVVFDPAQRRDRLEIGGEPTVAAWHGLVGLEQAVHRELDVTELSSHSGGATNDDAVLHDAAAEPGSDDRRHGGAVHCVDTEEMLVGVQGGGVAIVVVDHRHPEA